MPSRTWDQQLPSRAAPVLSRLALHAVRPTALATALAALVVVPFGWWFGALGAAGLVLAQVGAGFGLSCVAHEGAHVLLAPRDVEGRSWHVVSTWTGVSVIGPPGVVRRANAAAGPLVGAAVCLSLAAVGWSVWVCVTLLTLHLVNLSPLCPDGRVLAERAPARGPRPAPAPSAPAPSEVR